MSASVSQQQQQCGVSKFVGLDTSQPFAALKQQVNMRSNGSRVLATAVVIMAERLQSSCGLDAKQQQRAETTSRISNNCLGSLSPAGSRKQFSCRSSGSKGQGWV